MTTRRSCARLLLAAALAARMVQAQEPPPVPQEQEEQEGQEEKEQEQKERQQEEQEDVTQGPPPAPVEEVEGGEPTPPPAPPVVVAEPVAVEDILPPAAPAVPWPLSSEALAVHLRGIAEAHPTIARLEGIGRSAQGREILVLRLGLRDGAENLRPTLLVADHQGRSSVGPEAMVALAWRIAVEHERDERLRGLLATANLVLAPTLDPDTRSASAVDLTLGASSAEPAPRAVALSTAPPVRFERNFPSGWQPEALRPGSGRVSLSMPESLAAARFLANVGGCAVVMGFTPSLPQGAPYAGAELPDADREVFRRVVAALELEGARPLVPWFELGAPGGGVFDFAYQARGIYPLFFPLPEEDELARTGSQPFVEEVGRRVLACLALLPRVELAQEALERLAPDTWQLDLRLQNTGIVPTTSALARHRESTAEVTLELSGAKLLATARRPNGEADYTAPALWTRAPLSAGTLAGGEQRWLRLLLEAGSGAEVSVTASSAWAGRASLRLILP